ncbi:site-specific tyrosine recombinase XerC [Thalassoglobus neptunius]|uniref:Site-specific tyrosine recombinase XerC n=1 Tax=Thalassoglobus neptunius TaxID=1938619 RepID=A0A5C5VQB3_9PLAN|nr:site-specific integrase [Thalassoglobus neptunius]TWT39899.1 site-specific tyrosine recombinase XerC [Thalassoglobus neptunius]
MRSNVPVYVVRRSGRRFWQLKWIDPVTKKTIFRSTGTTVKREADRAAAKIEQQFSDGTFADPLNVTWKEFRDRYELEHLESLSDGNFLRVNAVLRWVERILKPRLLRSIDAGSISRLAKAMRSEGLEEATIKGNLAKLKSALNWAKTVDLLEEVPAFPKHKRAKRSTKTSPMKGRPITFEEFERMLRAIPAVITSQVDHARWVFFLNGLWYSGLRLGEALNLWWEGHEGLLVDLSTYRYPMFRIPSDGEKGGKDRIHPMTPDFAKFLKKVPSRRRFGRVFSLPSRSGEELQLDAVSRKVCALGEVAGVKVSKTKFASAHDLRRSFGDRWAVTVPMHYLQQLMRHESLDTTMRFYVGQNSEQVSSFLYETDEKPPQKKRRKKSP